MDLNDVIEAALDEEEKEKGSTALQDLGYYSGFTEGFRKGIEFAVNDMSCMETWDLCGSPDRMQLLNEIREVLREKYSASRA